jgi:hypothetical protein
MGRQNGVYQDAKGRWRVDKLHRGERLQGRFESHQEAEAWLIAKCAEIDSHGPVSARSMTLAEAATRYLLEEERAGKPSLSTETYLLEPVVACAGHLQLDQVHDNLRCNWEIQVDLDDIQCSVFEVPKEYVKGRKTEGYLVCNSVAQAILEQVRGQHNEFVFVWRRERVKNFDKEPAMKYQPIESMNNTAWQTARRKAGLADLHVHDLRHTVGMRLREAGVKEDTRADILWHVRPGMTAHYSEAQICEIRTALELIKDEAGRQNRSLRSLAKEAREGLTTGVRVPSGSLRQRKTA